MTETQDTHKYIVELEADEVQFIAAAVHAVLYRIPDQPVVSGLLESLIVQTNLVSSNPVMHGANYKLVAPVTPAQHWGETVGDIDMASYLSAYFQPINIQDI
jgi:hypothetical protein